MTTLCDELKSDLQLDAGLTSDEGPWRGTGRGAWPAGTRLEARRSASGTMGAINLVGWRRKNET
jgi:hypothetical protein